MKIKDYIYPTRVFKSLQRSLTDRAYFAKYSKILEDLDKEGKLKRMGFRKEESTLFIGVNLNPELLMYTEDSKESVELKFVSDSMKKYTDFLQNEGILDVIKAEYERVATEDFYGYVVLIRFDYKNYEPKKFRYDLGYFAGLGLITLGGIILGLQSIL